MDKLLCIITGPERNGTTYLEKLVYSIPGVFSGFECGLLQNKDFNKTKPFNEWIYHGNFHFGCDKSVSFKNDYSFSKKYELLFLNKGSGYENNKIQKLIKHSDFIVDKTPAYFRNIEDVIINLNNDSIPILITIKYLKQYYYSLCIKRNESLSDFIHIVKRHLNSLRFLKTYKGSNIYVFNYNNIIKPEFAIKLKNILQKYGKIDLDNIELSINNYNKKIDDNECPYYKWNDNYDLRKITLPNELIIFEKEYNELIDKLEVII
jgi:hypothetical protein